jgi:hypothetical protein
VLAVALVGPGLHLLTLLRAQGQPLHNWEDPSTLPALWQHATARVYQKLLRVPNGTQLLGSLRGFGALFLANFPWLLGLLPLLGGWHMLRQPGSRVTSGSLLLGALIVAVYNQFYSIQDVAAYYLPVWCIGLVLLAHGLDALGFKITRPSDGAAAVEDEASNPSHWMERPLLRGAAALMLAGVPLVRNLPACNLSDATWVRDFARQKLECADPKAVLITQGDQDICPIWYVHELLGVRSDVTVLDRTLTRAAWQNLAKDPTLSAPEQAAAGAANRTPFAADGRLIHLLTGPLADRPVCMTFATVGTPQPGDEQQFIQWLPTRFVSLPLGLILRLQPRERPVDLPAVVSRNEALWERIEFPNLSDSRLEEDLDPEYVTNHYACMLVNFGGLYEASGKPEQARTLYRRAAEWAPHFPGAQAALRGLGPELRSPQLPEPARAMRPADRKS